MKNKELKLSPQNIALIGIMVAIIEVCKLTLSVIPNVELTSFWLIMFTLYFGARIIYVIPVFILIEGVIFGFGLWWLMYLYAWPLLVLIVWKSRKTNDVLTMAIISGVFGLFFGALCSIPYWITGGSYAAFSWWIAGIPWDIVHGVSNFIIMLVLYHPIKRVLMKTRERVLNIE